MSDEAEIEAEVNRRLVTFEKLFEQMVVIKGATHKWTEVTVNEEQLKEAVHHAYRRRNFRISTYDDFSVRTREISLFCFKVRELRPFILDNYLDKRDINACLNSRYFFQAIKGMRYRIAKKHLIERGEWEKGARPEIEPSSPEVFDRLYRSFLFDELDEDRMVSLAGFVEINLHTSTYWLK